MRRCDRSGRRNAATKGTAREERSAGEIAALVFERFEQRHSLAEIVMALRIEPDAVRALFEQWTIGLTEGQLRLAREPTVMRDGEIVGAVGVTGDTSDNDEDCALAGIAAARLLAVA